MKTNDIHQLSEALLFAIKTGKPFDQLTKSLSLVQLNDLESQLSDDNLKKSFWINIYNSFFQILRKHRKLEKTTVYKKKAVLIAGEQFSLDDIEHGILRRYRYKYSLGYLPKVFVPKLIKRLAVSKLDHRIHFALNCGAKSCPPIAFYKKENINQQLSMAESSFLDSETFVDHKKKEIHTSKLLKWYLGDFGGKKGIRKLIDRVLNEKVKGYRICFSSYSWEEQLDNYIF